MRRLLYTFLGVIVAAGAAFYLATSFGPDREVRSAFESYKAAYAANAPDTVASLTSDADIRLWDEQRRMALTADEAVVKALDFMRRGIVIGLRAGVLDGRMTLAALQTLQPRQLYAATRDMKLYPRLIADMDVLFVLPTGSGTARGYVSMTKLPPAFAGHFELLALVQGLFYNFERQDDGRWLVDPSPLVAGSALGNEQIAKMLEPTGNVYLTVTYNQTKDPVREAMLWQPLAKE